MASRRLALGMSPGDSIGRPFTHMDAGRVHRTATAHAWPGRRTDRATRASGYFAGHLIQLKWYSVEKLPSVESIVMKLVVVVGSDAPASTLSEVLMFRFR